MHPTEPAPIGLLPRLAAAHRTPRQLARDRHAVAAVGALEISFCHIAGPPELDVVPGSTLLPHQTP